MNKVGTKNVGYLPFRTCSFVSKAADPANHASTSFLYLSSSGVTERIVCIWLRLNATNSGRLAAIRFQYCRCPSQSTTSLGTHEGENNEANARGMSHAKKCV